MDLFNRLPPWSHRLKKRGRSTARTKISLKKLSPPATRFLNRRQLEVSAPSYEWYIIRSDMLVSDHLGLKIAQLNLESTQVAAAGDPVEESGRHGFPWSPSSSALSPSIAPDCLTFQ
jgi:hypothetical protein